MPENAKSPLRFPIPAGNSRARRSLRFRLRLVLPLVRFRLRHLVEERPVVVLSSLGIELRTLNELINYEASLSRVSRRSLWRWYGRFLQEGQKGLARKIRRDADVSKSFEHRGLAVCFVLDKKADGWQPAAIHRALFLLWPRLYRDGSAAPSYSSVRRFLRNARP